jgi:hypothetical protein
VRGGARLKGALSVTMHLLFPASAPSSGFSHPWHRGPAPHIPTHLLPSPSGLSPRLYLPGGVWNASACHLLPSPRIAQGMEALYPHA